MAEALATLGTVSSILQLVDTAIKACDHLKDFVNAPQEQQKLLSEKSPLADFKTMMEQLMQKLSPGDGPLSRFSKQLKWTLGNKKEANEYLGRFEQFKSLLNSWLLLDLWSLPPSCSQNVED
jgi:hypothetical protein